jgi:hypothetical protein
LEVMSVGPSPILSVQAGSQTDLGIILGIHLLPLRMIQADQQ